MFHLIYSELHIKVTVIAILETDTRTIQRHPEDFQHYIVQIAEIRHGLIRFTDPKPLSQNSIGNFRAINVAIADIDIAGQDLFFL